MPEIAHSRLGRKIIFLIFLAGAVPLALFGELVYLESGPIFEEEARITLEGYSRLAAGEIARTIELAEANLAVITGDTIPVAGVLRRVTRFDSGRGLGRALTSGEPALGLDTAIQAILRDRELAVSPPYATERGTTIALYLRRNGGRIIAAELDPYHLWGVTRGSIYGPNQALLVVDADRRILASSLHLPADARLDAIFSPRPPVPFPRAGEPDAAALFPPLLVASQAIRLAQPNGSLRWQVYICRSVATVSELRHRLIVQPLALLAALSAALLLLLSVMFARHLQIPVLRLARVADRLGGGDLACRADENRRDELGDLARAFNRMARELEREIQERVRLDGEAAIGRMASIVAHEVNNPLTALKVRIGQLAARQAEAEKKEIRVIDQQIERIGRTVRSLLDFSHRQSQMDDLVSLRTVVAVVTAFIEQAYRSQATALTVELPDELPPVRGNAERLQQAIFNLLENARQAVGRGGNVRISAHGSAKTVRIVVEDDGPGLAEPTERLFDPFYTTKTSGVGLGLSIARQICRAHGGELAAENRGQPTGRGSRFTIQLPAAGEREEAR